MKRSSYSPGSVSSVDTQEEGQKSNLVGPPKISKKLETDFEAAIGDIVQEKHTGLDTTGAYTPNNVDSDNKTGRYIVADAKFVTESVGMNFSKESTSRDKLVLFRKVIDHMERCKETIDDPDNERFAQIVKNFKVSNFGHIFSRTGFPSKADHPEFIKVKRLFQCTLAIRRSE